MFPLKQSTASQEIPLGPFVDDTDGKTAETGLTIANTDIKIWVYGGTTEASKNSGGATHIASGRYYAVLDATDTATIGPLRASVHVAGALPVWLDCFVYPSAVFDVLFGSSAVGTAQTGDTYAYLTTALTESYAADGAAATMAQLLYLMLAVLTEASRSGTTITAKKLDASTTAATFTIDDATTPTSITRAS